MVICNIVKCVIKFHLRLLIAAPKCTAPIQPTSGHTKTTQPQKHNRTAPPQKYHHKNTTVPLHTKNTTNTTKTPHSVFFFCKCPPRSNGSKTRRSFRSQVIDGALEEKEDRRSSHWVRNTCSRYQRCEKK